MKITLICIGKTDDDFIKVGIEKYLKRLKHYITFNIIVLQDVKDVKNLSVAQQKEKEGKLFLKNINTTDFVVLLDEHGKEYRSIEFSSFIEKKMISSVNNLVFLIGGPYGFSDEIKSLAKQSVSLSKMTFSHQMIRLFFIEQIYRAFTIMKGEPYHHE